MEITKFGHACVRIEADGAVMVIDPGGFTEPAALDGADAVLITHEHGDHLDVDRLTDALARRPSVDIYTHAAVAGLLGDLASAVTEVATGQEFTAAGLSVRAYGGWHAQIHPDLPPTANLGFLVGGSIYHPGDSFDVPADADVDTLFVPISAPWLKASESIDFVRAVAPRQAFALHDGLLNANGLGLVDGLLGRLAGAPYRRLASGDTITVG